MPRSKGHIGISSSHFEPRTKLEFYINFKKYDAFQIGVKKPPQCFLGVLCAIVYYSICTLLSFEFACFVRSGILFIFVPRELKQNHNSLSYYLFIKNYQLYVKAHNIFSCNSKNEMAKYRLDFSSSKPNSPC